MEVEEEMEEVMLGDAYLKGDSISLKAGNIFRKQSPAFLDQVYKFAES